MKKLLLSLTLSFTLLTSFTYYLNLNIKDNKVHHLSGESAKFPKESSENTWNAKNAANTEENKEKANEAFSNISSKSAPGSAAAATSVLLVNKSNKLSRSYIPEDLVTPKVEFISFADPSVKKMDSEAAEALEKLFDAAYADGISLLAVSSYRNYDYQKMLYNNKVKAAGKAEADKYVAQPGASEHQTGLAMDVLSTEYSSLDEGFGNTQAYKWLKENCADYGFIIRYPKDKANITKYNFEPWHIRYVGLTASKEIMDNEITLEEYLKGR